MSSPGGLDERQRSQPHPEPGTGDGARLLLESLLGEGLTKAKIAKYLGKSRQMVSDVALGKRRVPASWVPELEWLASQVACWRSVQGVGEEGMHRATLRDLPLEFDRKKQKPRIPDQCPTPYCKGWITKTGALVEGEHPCHREECPHCGPMKGSNIIERVVRSGTESYYLSQFDTSVAPPSSITRNLRDRAERRGSTGHTWSLTEDSRLNVVSNSDLGSTDIPGELADQPTMESFVWDAVGRGIQGYRSSGNHRTPKPKPEQSIDLDELIAAQRAEAIRLAEEEGVDLPWWVTEGEVAVPKTGDGRIELLPVQSRKERDLRHQLHRLGLGRELDQVTMVRLINTALLASRGVVAQSEIEED